MQPIEATISAAACVLLFHAGGCQLFTNHLFFRPMAASFDDFAVFA